MLSDVSESEGGWCLFSFAAKMVCLPVSHSLCDAKEMPVSAFIQLTFMYSIRVCTCLRHYAI